MVRGIKGTGKACGCLRMNGTDRCGSYVDGVGE